jgi:hypothetical protein
MEAVNRPAVDGGINRPGNHHYWRGGHHKKTVHDALQAELVISKESKGKATLTLTNIGPDHFLPTGTPDRYLSILFSLTDPAGKVIQEKHYALKRTIMWRPFIIDLWDTRLRKNIPRELSFSWKKKAVPLKSTLTVSVRYHLLDEARRKRINYNNNTPISYQIFQQTISL